MLDRKDPFRGTLSLSHDSFIYCFSFYSLANATHDSHDPFHFKMTQTLIGMEFKMRSSHF